MSAIITFIIFLLIVLLGGIGVALWLFFSERELPKDRVYVNHFFSNYSIGYFRGLLLKIHYGSKRSIVEFLPEDVDEDKEGKIKPIKTVVENSKIISFAKGTLSQNSTILWLLPPTAEDLNESVKRTPQGKYIKKMITDINANTNTEEVYEDALRNISEIKKSTHGLNLMKERIYDDFNNFKKYKKQLSEGKSGGGNLPSPGYGQNRGGV
ncbi:MAG: hypothetical protein ACOCRX_07670 [Candidatus Woesearchaeota archaeon]